MKTHESIQQFAKMLRNLDTWLGKAEAHAKAKSFDPNTLLNSRLAPDMYPLVRQVQSACDSSKFSAAYLSGKQAPAHADNEQTMAELHERIAKVLSFFESVKEADLVGAEERKVAPKWLEGKWLRGDHYLTQVGQPNFYFHVAMAYAILRHNGVELGKADYIGSMPLKD
jgi:hypothetical protein